MFLASLFLSIVIAFSIMENAGNYALLIVMVIALLIIFFYVQITIKYFKNDPPFEFKMHFLLIIFGTGIGTFIYCIHSYFEQVAKFVTN